MTHDVVTVVHDDMTHDVVTVVHDDMTHVVTLLFVMI